MTYNPQRYNIDFKVLSPNERDELFTFWNKRGKTRFGKAGTMRMFGIGRAQFNNIIKKYESMNGIKNNV